MAASNRKRKASEEPSDNERMSTSPSVSPSISGRLLPHPLHRNIKRTRTGTGAVGTPLALPRLLETLSADSMRELLQNICDRHPSLQSEIASMAPRPSVDSALTVLSRYEQSFREAFPLGNRHTSDYAYNRVRTHLLALIDAVREFTPHFLPPHETQDSLSLAYLDAVTHMIHRLPDWDTFQHRRHKNEAYDEIAQAWASVLRAAAKRAGGFHLSFGGWDQKLLDHSRSSAGKMEAAAQELKLAQGLHHHMAAGQGMNTSSSSSADASVGDERASIRQQLFSGTYGHGLGVGQGRW
jgi:protein Cut8